MTLQYTTQIYNSQRTVNVGDSAMKQKLVDEARRRIVVPYREVSCCYCCMLYNTMYNALQTVALLLHQCLRTQVLPCQLYEQYTGAFAKPVLLSVMQLYLRETCVML
jgi:hypothetical protein